MPLVYKKRRPPQLTYPEEEYVELTAPEEWGMFTSKGNKSLQKKAQTLLDKLDKTSHGEAEKQISYLLQFLRAYHKMGYTETMGEASDTAVRECVWIFFERACEAIGLGSSADDLWEKAY